MTSTTLSSNANIPCREAGTLVGHSGGVMVAKFNGNGRYCLTGGKDRLVKLWNPHTQLLIKTYKGHGFEVTDVAASHDSSMFVSCGADKMMIVWDVSTGHVKRKIRAHGNRINCLALNAEASAVLTGSYDSTVKIWDLKSSMREPMQVLDDAKDSVTSVQLTDTELLVSSVDGHTRLYDLRMGKMCDDQHSDAVTCARFSNDQNCILVSTLDSTIRLLDKENGTMLAKYVGHENKRFQLTSTMSYDDAHVWSGSEDGRVVCWDLVNASVMTEFTVCESVVSSIAYHPKKHCLVTASTGVAEVKVWKTKK
eukprot:m.47269 g.47269  ORF g.47269 m.47269 type:complete len:309 (-) comp10754_c0_seq2:107-1033(-)